MIFPGGEHHGDETMKHTISAMHDGHIEAKGEPVTLDTQTESSCFALIAMDTEIAPVTAEVVNKSNPDEFEGEFDGEVVPVSSDDENVEMSKVRTVDYSDDLAISMDEPVPGMRKRVTKGGITIISLVDIDMPDASPRQVLNDSELLKGLVMEGIKNFKNNTKELIGLAKWTGSSGKYSSLNQFDSVKNSAPVTNPMMSLYQALTKKDEDDDKLD